MARYSIPTIMFLVGSACAGTAISSGVPGQIALPSDLPAEAAKVVTTAWPKAVQACPGFDKFLADLRYSGIEDNRSYAPPDAHSVTVRLKVAENPKTIPGALRAGGHNCHYEIAPDGKTMSIGKTPCASVCLGADAESRMPMRTRVMKIQLR